MSLLLWSPVVCDVKWKKHSYEAYNCFNILSMIVCYACFDLVRFRFDMRWKPDMIWTELGNEKVSLFHSTMNTCILTKEEIKWVTLSSWFHLVYNTWTEVNLASFSCTLFWMMSMSVTLIVRLVKYEHECFVQIFRCVLAVQVWQLKWTVVFSGAPTIC